MEFLYMKKTVYEWLIANIILSCKELTSMFGRPPLHYSHTKLGKNKR